jgi:hypothetical protein
LLHTPPSPFTFKEVREGGKKKEERRKKKEERITP